MCVVVRVVGCDECGGCGGDDSDELVVGTKHKKFSQQKSAKEERFSCQDSNLGCLIQSQE